MRESRRASAIDGTPIRDTEGGRANEVNRPSNNGVYGADGLCCCYGVWSSHFSFSRYVTILEGGAIKRVNGYACCDQIDYTFVLFISVKSVTDSMRYQRNTTVPVASTLRTLSTSLSR